MVSLLLGLFAIHPPALLGVGSELLLDLIIPRFQASHHDHRDQDGGISSHPSEMRRMLAQRRPLHVETASPDSWDI